MKKAFLALLFLISIFLGSNDVYATSNITNLRELQLKMQEQIDKFNASSSCYDTEVKLINDKEINIYYKLKEGKTCAAVGDSIVKITENEYGVYILDFTTKKETDIKEQDNRLFDFFSRVMNYGLTVANVVDTYDDYDFIIPEKNIYGYITWSIFENYEGDKLYYIPRVGFLLDHDTFEVEETNTNSIVLKSYEYALSRIEYTSAMISVSTDGVNYVNPSFENPDAGLQLKIIDLKPNTKYYIKINSSIYGEHNLVATTLSDGKPVDTDNNLETEEENTNNKVNESDSNKGDNIQKEEVTNNEETKKNDVENPNTGSKTVGFILIAGICILVLIYKKRNIFKKI